MALSNVTQLKEVLDAIYNKSLDPDIYDGDDLGGIRLYYNEETRLATIFRYNEDGKETIIAIFDPETFPYTDQSEEYYYNCKAIQSSSISGSETSVFTRGLGAYLDIKVFIRNCLAFLGVSTTSNFDELNPGLYNDMVNIVNKYTGELNNNVEYYLGKYIDSSVESYRPYVPLLCIVDLAVYLNNLGIFTQNIKLYNIGVPAVHDLLSLNILMNNSLAPKLSDFFTTMSKDDFFKNTKIVLDDFYLPNSSNKEYLDRIINSMKNIYASDMSSDNLLLCWWGDGLSSNPILKIYEVPMDCSPISAIYNLSSSILQICNIERNFQLTVYTVEYNISDPSNIVILNNKETTVINQNTLYTFDNRYNFYSNIKTDKFYKTCVNRINKSNTYYYTLDYFARPDNNTYYNKEDLHLLDSTYLSTCDIVLSTYLKNNNIEFTSDDFVLVFGRINTFGCFVVIFSDISQIKSNAFSSIVFNQIGGFTYNKTMRNNVETNYDLASRFFEYSGFGNEPNLSINFGSNVNMKIYKVFEDGDGLISHTLLYNTSISDFNIRDYGISTAFRWSNYGEIIDLSQNELEGISLMDNAVYPISVSGESSFRSLYNNAIYRVIQNPWLEDDELQGTLSPWSYVNCSVSKNPPDNQADAQDFDLDDLSDDEVADIIKDIDKASGDDDSPEDDVPPNEEGFEEEGNSPAPEPIDNLSEPLDFGMFKMYVLTRAQAADVGHNLAAADFWSFADKFFNNPIDSIISVQSTNVITANDSTSVVEAVQINGKTLNNPAVTARRLKKSKSEIDLGYIEIPAKYNNYLDITNTKMKIYLPFVGFVDLNIAEFVGGGMNLWARIDHYTGDIVYFIYSSRNDLHRCVATAQGNSQKQIPLTSNNFMRFFQGLLGGGS